MTPARVLVVEDDDAIRRGIADALRFSGYDVIEASDGPSGLDAALTREPDLVLLDVLMPGIDGFAVLGEVRRARPRLPVIFLTALGAEHDRVRGLRGGADDYVIKPFSPAELTARVEAVLRRVPERPAAVQTLTIAGRRIDFERAEAVLPSGRTAPLSERELAFLHYLASSPGRFVTRDELLSRVWGVDPRGVQTRAVDMLVARLRELLEDDPKNPVVVLTVRGRGYSLGAGGAGA